MVKTEDFFKELASRKTNADKTKYLRGLLSISGKETIADLYKSGFIQGRKPRISNLKVLQQIAEGKEYDNLSMISQYKTAVKANAKTLGESVASAQKVAQEKADELSFPFIEEILDTQEEERQAKNYDDAVKAIDKVNKELAEKALGKVNKEITKDAVEKVNAKIREQEEKLAKARAMAKKINEEYDAMQVADTTAVAEAKAKERREEMLRPNPKAKTSQRDKTEKREYAREDTNKEQRAKAVDKRRALERWSNDIEFDTNDLLQELGFNKRQIDDNTNARVKKAKKTLEQYESAELTDTELFDMMDTLIDPPPAPTQTPTQSPDERDAKPKAKEYVSSSGERRPMGERPFFRADAKRQAEEAVEADKKALSMKKQEQKDRDQKKARDAKVQKARSRVQQARSNMRQEVEVSASGGGSGGRKLDNEYQRILADIMIGGYDGKYGSHLSTLPTTFVNDVLLVQDETSFTNFYAKMVEQFGEPSGTQNTNFYTQPRAPPRSQADVDRAVKMAGHFDNIPKKSAPADTPDGTGSGGQPPPRPTMTRPERSDSMSSGDDFPTPIITDTPRADGDGDNPMGEAPPLPPSPRDDDNDPQQPPQQPPPPPPPPPPPAGVGVQQPDVPAQGMSLGASSGVSSASGGGGLAPTKAELIPKERLSVEGKSPQELLADIMYFFKNFASQLKPIKAKWDKLSKRQKSNEAVLKRYHGMIVGRLQPEGSKAEEGRVGIVVDAEQYIEMKMREIMLDARFANMQPAELVDVNEGIKKKQATDMGAFEVRQGLRGGKSFIQREPVYKAISTSQPDQLAVQMRPPGKATQPKRLSLMPAKQINLATTAKSFNNANPFARSVPTITLKVLK